MYYSRLLLNPRSSRVRRDIADDFEMHRTVMSAFPKLDQRKRDDPGSGSILWRVDHDRRRGIVMLIVQSELAPDWQPLLSKFPGYLSSPPDTELPPVATMDRHLQFHSGQMLAFRLRANPTRKVRAEGKKNGQRMGLTLREDQLAWLSRKVAEPNRPLGFRLHKVTVMPNPGPRRKTESGDNSESGGVATVARQLTHVAAIFEGVLEVTDCEAFQNTLRAGIGSAKAFGFGLLSVARA